MARAVVENGLVVNTVIASEDDAYTIAIPEGSNVGIGWFYDGTTFSAPSQPTISFKKYTIASFIEAMTRVEALNFLATMKTDPLLEMWYELAKARGVIDFNDSETYENAPYLVQAGVFTQERLNELTGGPNGN